MEYHLNFSGTGKMSVSAEAADPEAAVTITIRSGSNYQIGSCMKPGNKLTPELMERINKIIRNPGFKNFDYSEKKYRISRYEIFAELKRQKIN